MSKFLKHDFTPEQYLEMMRKALTSTTGKADLEMQVDIALRGIQEMMKKIDNIKMAKNPNLEPKHLDQHAKKQVLIESAMILLGFVTGLTIKPEHFDLLFEDIKTIAEPAAKAMHEKAVADDDDGNPEDKTIH